MVLSGILLNISEDHLDKILKPFFTFSLKDEDSGTGIGLALVKEIIDEHNGDIQVSSRQGEGTTFTIRIPRLVTAAASPAMMPTAREDMARTRRKILFVDSQNANLSAYEKSFGQMHDVLLASTFEQASELVENHVETLDVLVCELPSTDDLARGFIGDILKSQELGKRLILIGEAGESQDAAKTRGYRVLNKPVRPSILLGAIYEVPLKKPEAIT